MLFDHPVGPIGSIGQKTIAALVCLADFTAAPESAACHFRIAKLEALGQSDQRAVRRTRFSSFG